MKKSTTALCKFLFAFLIAITFNYCTKSDFSSTQPDSKTLANSVAKPNIYPGPCPYDCHDSRCKAYSGGYCGSLSDTVAIIKNSNNPYDYVGQQHNNGLKNIFPNVNPSSNNLDSVVLIKDKIYTTSLGYNSDSLQSFYNKAVQQGYFPFSQIQELDELGNSLQNNRVISSYANNYVQQIYNYASSYLNTTNGSLPTQSNYSLFANAMISLENQIISNGNLSILEKNTLLSSCAIARYSASYWANYINSNIITNSVTKNNLLAGNITPLSLKSWLHNWGFWWKVAISDVGGGLVGIIGGPIGIIGGAVGTSVVTAVSIA